MRQIDIELGHASYSITIERGSLRDIGQTVMQNAPHIRAFLVADATVMSQHGETAASSLREQGYLLATHSITARESLKTLETVRELYDAMLAAKLDRNSPVVALGGGIVGDVAGFAAATYMRGLPVIQAPTTLLAMVDASIGGKTGVNFPRSGGEPVKNLIGAFWHPAAVVIDPETLRTLEPREFRCGLAECVKHAMIADVDLLTFIAENAAAINDLDLDVLEALIERSVKIKAAIVTEDERESGRRALLNLGHTFAHAIEPIPQLDLRHGEAVAIGLIAAMHCAATMGRVEAADQELIAELLTLLDLPIELPQPVRISTLMEAMSYDKKVAQGRLRLILPDGLGDADVVQHVPIEAITAAWRSVGAADE